MDRFPYDLKQNKTRQKIKIKNEIENPKNLKEHNTTPWMNAFSLIENGAIEFECKSRPSRCMIILSRFLTLIHCTTQS